MSRLFLPRRTSSEPSQDQHGLSVSTPPISSLALRLTHRNWTVLPFSRMVQWIGVLSLLLSITFGASSRLGSRNCTLSWLGMTVNVRHNALVRFLKDRLKSLDVCSSFFCWNQKCGCFWFQLANMFYLLLCTILPPGTEWFLWLKQLFLCVHYINKAK